MNNRSKGLFGVTRSNRNAREILSSKNVNFIPLRHAAAYDCLEGATARGIPVTNELKSLLLIADRTRCVLLNLRGDHRFDNGLVRELISADDVKFASKSQLKKIDVGTGLINPFDLVNCEMFNDKALLELTFIGTNDGSPESGVLVSTRDFFESFPGRFGNFGVLPGDGDNE